MGSLALCAFAPSVTGFCASHAVVRQYLPPATSLLGQHHKLKRLQMAATTGDAASQSAPLLEDRPETPTLREWLGTGKFALALAPGFFGFYAHIGAVMALDDAGLLEGNIAFVCGASAGGLVAGLLAAGLTPREMAAQVVEYRRGDFWDPPGFGGVLRGRKFQSLIAEALPVRTFEECKIPLGVTGFSISKLRTRAIYTGDLAPALRASCTFPVLFQPVWHRAGVLIDGGVFDTAGMWCVPDSSECVRVLNISFGTDPQSASVPPSEFPAPWSKRPNSKEITSLILTGLPRPHPFAMHKGAEALQAAYDLVTSILDDRLLEGHEPRHLIAPTGAAPSGTGTTLPERAGAAAKAAVTAPLQATCDGGVPNVDGPPTSIQAGCSEAGGRGANRGANGGKGSELSGPAAGLRSRSKRGKAGAP